MLDYMIYHYGYVGRSELAHDFKNGTSNLRDYAYLHARCTRAHAAACSTLGQCMGQ